MDKNKKKSYLVTMNKTKKDMKEIEKIIERKREVDKLDHDLNKVTEQINSYKSEIKMLFTRSNAKETQLKSYIAKLSNEIMEKNVNIDPLIINKTEDVDNLISEVQSIIKKEIIYTKNEMEREINKKFSEAEKNQTDLMNAKIQEQKKVLEKMNKTREEIESIRFDFERINLECDKLTKEHESLKILLSSLEEDNICLVDKINLLKEEYFNLKVAHKKVFSKQTELVERIEEMIGADVSLKERSDSEEDSNEKILNFEREETNQIQTINSPKNEIFNINTNNTFNSLTNRSMKSPLNINNNKINQLKDNPEQMIPVIKKELENIQNENKKIKKQYIKEFQQKNEAQQLMQKCIEDLKFDLVKVTKEITFLKNEMAMANTISLSELNSKLQYKVSLEEKLKIMTFVYDNAFLSENFKNNTFFNKVK